MTTVTGPFDLGNTLDFAQCFVAVLVTAMRHLIGDSSRIRPYWPAIQLRFSPHKIGVDVKESAVFGKAASSATETEAQLGYF